MCPGFGGTDKDGQCVNPVKINSTMNLVLSPLAKKKNLSMEKSCLGTRVNEVCKTILCRNGTRGGGVKCLEGLTWSITPCKEILSICPAGQYRDGSCHHCASGQFQDEPGQKSM